MRGPTPASGYIGFVDTPHGDIPSHVTRPTGTGVHHPHLGPAMAPAGPRDVPQRSFGREKIPPFYGRVGCDAESALAAKDVSIVPWKP
jgi:hypothetical protein